MKELLEYLISSIVDNPKKVEITESEENGTVTFTIKADTADMGKIIGRGGKIIRSLRTLMHTRALKEDKKVLLMLQE